MAFTLKRTSAHRNNALVSQWLRVDRDAADLPATAAEEIFQVTGGRVLVHLLLGEVTTAIQNQTCNLKVTVNPTDGTSADVASNLDIDNDEVGTLYFPEGDGTALIGVNAGTGFSAGTNQAFIAPVGGIDIETGATNTGAIKWSIWYQPLDDGAVVNAS